MEMKKIALFISFILIANLIFAQPSTPYTILIYVYLYGLPVSNATVIVTELATNESGIADQEGEGLYGINLGNFEHGWSVGDYVLIEVFYDEYYVSATIVLTNEGYSVVNISLRDNTPPVANNDSYTTNEDIVLIINAPGILGNDYDADGDTLTAVSVSNPTHGSLTFNSNGSFLYTPNSNYYGTDSFTYKAYDGFGYSNIATVYITINSINDAPVANDDYASMEEDNSIIISVLSNDYDIDGTINESSLRIIQNASHGNITVNSNGTVTYTPEENYYGNDSFKYRFMDNGNTWSNTANVYINISPVNDKPTAYLISPENNSVNININATLAVHLIDIDSNSMSVKFYGRKLGNSTWQFLGINTDVANDSNTSLIWYNLQYNTTYEWYVVANDSIAENSSDIWRFTTQAINTPPVANDDSYSTDEDIALTVNTPGVLENDNDIDGDNLTAILVSNPNHGTVVLNSNSSFTYTPNSNYHGTDSFTYKAYDGIAYSNIATVYITINSVNDAPVANDDYASTDEDTPVLINLSANDYDIDGNINLTSITITQSPSHGSVNVHSNGTVTYTPSLNYYGSDSFKYKAKDNDGADSNIATVTITINSTNDAPFANFTYEPLNPIIGQLIYFNSTSYDIDGYIVNWTWNLGDGNFAYEENVTHVYSGAGIYNVTLIVRDGDGATSSIVKEIVIQVGDLIPPLTTLTFGTPHYYDGTYHWITSATQITLTATDGESGVKATYYRIWYDGSWSDWTTYTESFTLADECLHYIEYYSEDKAGTIEDVHNQTVYVDNTPPETTLTFGTLHYYDGTYHWITTSTQITLTATDAPDCACGVDKIYYYIDALPAIEYTAPFTVTTTGVHTIYYYSVDNLGNTETTKSITVKVDNTPPDIILEIGEPKYNEYVRSTTQFNLSAIDEGSGIAFLEYRIFYENWSEWKQEENFKLQGEGIHYLEIRAIDNLGNTAYENETYYVDDSPPSSRVDEIILYEQEEIPFNISIVDIEDDGAGVCRVEAYYSYSENNITWSEWRLYTTFFIPYEQRYNVSNQTISFDAPEGVAFYRFISIAYDCLENKELPPYYHGTYDAECFFNASIFIRFGMPKYGEWISPFTPINISMKREGNIYYRIYHEGWHPQEGFYLYSGNFTINFSGTSYIEFYGDGLPVRNATVKVDVSAPETFILSEFFVVSPLLIECNAYDNESGLKCVEFYYQYSYDNFTWSDWKLESIDYSMPYTCIFSEIGFYNISTVGIDNVDNFEGSETKASVRIFNPDFNNDGLVNVQDLVIIAKNFDGNEAKFDINGDATVDLNDTRLIFEFWHKR
ncbi:MAG: tandem-95 repeat protein [Thermoplasmatales archaeon]|nr:tandem-95 repeat protein [Thermoplasmatales archaeon]